MLTNFHLATIHSEALRLQVLTHRSYGHENPDDPDNEKLEFLGDAVLGLVVAHYLYKRYPHLREAELTRLRSLLVDETQLARFARSLGLGSLVRLGRGAEKNGARHSSSVLSDTLEAWIGGLFWEQGLPPAYSFIQTLVETVLADPQSLASLGIQADGSPQGDIKGQLQHWALREMGELPKYQLVQEEGPDHKKVFTYEVIIGDRRWGQGQGHSKQEATKMAAQQALLNLQRAGQLA